MYQHQVAQTWHHVNVALWFLDVRHIIASRILSCLQDMYFKSFKNINIWQELCNELHCLKATISWSVEAELLYIKRQMWTKRGLLISVIAE